MTRKLRILLIACWTVLLLCFAFGAAFADIVEIDNLNDIYTISVNEEIYLPKPDWSGGEVSEAYIGSGDPIRKRETEDGKGYIFSSSEAGVFPMEAWIYVEGSPILKWVTLVVEDTDGTVPPPAFDEQMLYYDDVNNNWEYFGEPHTVQVDAFAGTSFFCMYRMVEYIGYYNYYQDFPTWTVTQISGPEYEYTAVRQDFIDTVYESGEVHSEPCGDFNLYFTLDSEVPGDAEYEITASWHGTTVSHRLIIHPMIPEKWELLLDGMEIADDFSLTMDGGRYIYRTFNIEYYGYFKNILSGKPEMEITKLSGQDIEYRLEGRENEAGEFWFDFVVESVPLTVSDSVYQVSCSWGEETVSRRMTIHVAEPSEPLLSFSFTEEDITVRTGEKYTLHVTGENFTLSDLTLKVYYGEFSENSEYSVNSEKNTIECCTDQPGLYVIALRTWNDYQNRWIEDYVVIRVMDENGNLPEVGDIYISPAWPRSAVVGESLRVNFWFWDSVSPNTWRMEVEHNGKIRYFDMKTSNRTVVFEEKGEYILRCYLTDALGREASAAAVCMVADPSPLKAESLAVTGVEVLGSNSYNVYLDLDYSGGEHSPSYHYKIFAKDSTGNWYMTWEEDSSIATPRFWIGEDGDHYFVAELTDGVTTQEVQSEVIQLYAGDPPASVLRLPDNLTSIEERAFENDTGICNVEAGSRLKRIESRAFAGCTSLTACYIPSGAEYIADDAFEGVAELIIISESEDSAAARYAERKGYTFRIGTGID